MYTSPAYCSPQTARQVEETESIEMEETSYVDQEDEETDDIEYVTEDTEALL